MRETSDVCICSCGRPLLCASAHAGDLCCAHALLERAHALHSLAGVTDQTASKRNIELLTHVIQLAECFYP